MTTIEKRIFISRWYKDTFSRDSWYKFSNDYGLEGIRSIELTLTPDQWARYDAHLADVTKARHRKGRRTYVHLRAMISASADERTEALVRMIKEETK